MPLCRMGVFGIDPGCNLCVLTPFHALQDAAISTNNTTIRDREQEGAFRDRGALYSMKHKDRPLEEGLGRQQTVERQLGGVTQPAPPKIKGDPNANRSNLHIFWQLR